MSWHLADLHTNVQKMTVYPGFDLAVIQRINKMILQLNFIQ